MFAKSVIALAAVASFAVAAPVEKRGAPADWAYGYLENYDTYHVRYLALKCYDQKNTAFFQDCCRPLLSTETLKDNRASYCVPSTEDTASVVASLAAKTAGGATATVSADSVAESEYCDTESSASSAAPSNTAVAAAYSSAPASASPAAKAAASSSVAAVQYVAPAKSSAAATTAAPTTPAWTPAPAATSTQAASSGGSSFNGGYATYFYQGGNAGACGTVHGDWDMIVAIDHEKWGSDSYGGGSSTCGKWLTITNTNNGKSVSAMVADVCPTCANGNSLDLSQGAFNAIASESDGQVPISWHWN